MTYAEYRRELNLTHAQLAAVLDVDERTSRRWENNEREVPGPVMRFLWACERDREIVHLLLAAC